MREPEIQTGTRVSAHHRNMIATGQTHFCKEVHILQTNFISLINLLLFVITKIKESPDLTNLYS